MPSYVPGYDKEWVDLSPRHKSVREKAEANVGEFLKGGKPPGFVIAGPYVPRQDAAADASCQVRTE